MFFVSQSRSDEVRGKKYDCYMMTRDGFAFLAMGFTGKKAAHWKEAYINAFNAMEKRLTKNTQDLEWKQARLQGKQARKSFTDEVKTFVEYATEQGSGSAFRYYGNLTTMEYKALELIERSCKKVPDDFRDTLDSMDLCFLATAEQVAKNSLKEGMNRELPYKEIFKLAKRRVEDFARTVTINKISN